MMPSDSRVRITGSPRVKAKEPLEFSYVPPAVVATCCAAVTKDKVMRERSSILVGIDRYG
jgi:hypothetical protein